jgi:hypothetical protein
MLALRGAGPVRLQAQDAGAFGRVKKKKKKKKKNRSPFPILTDGRG